jgi:dolichol-phosphate mannosyltransferase
MNNKISIILSTFNEGYIIEETIKEIFENVENVEIILVDDNSNDETFEKVKNLNNPNIKLYSRNSRGLASAFLLGLINTEGNIVGWFDSNMPSLMKRVPDMLKELESNDLVILSRFVEGGKDERTFTRVWSSIMINFICRLFLGHQIKDYTSSIFLMHKKNLINAVPICYGHGEFFIEFLYKLKKNGSKISEIPYVHPPDHEGMSKTATNIIRFIKLGIDYIVRIIITRFRKN